jgi:hypothetical protein
MSSRPSEGDLVARMRRICMALPEMSERLSHGTPTWFVRGRTQVVQYWSDTHREIHFAQLWCAAPPGAQEALVEAEPRRFFRPPYCGHRGWLGVRMDLDIDWTEIAAIVEDAYRVVAPKKLVDQLDGPRGSRPYSRRT